MDSITIGKLKKLREHFNNDRLLAKKIGFSRNTLYRRLNSGKVKPIEKSAIIALYAMELESGLINGNRKARKTMLQLTPNDKKKFLDDFLYLKNNNVEKLAEKHNISYYVANKLINNHFKKLKDGA